MRGGSPTARSWDSPPTCSGRSRTRAGTSLESDSEPGGVAGRPVGCVAPADVPGRKHDVVLVVQGVVQLDGDLLAAVHAGAQPHGAQLADHVGVVVVGVQDQVAPTPALV